MASNTIRQIKKVYLDRQSTRKTPNIEQDHYIRCPVRAIGMHNGYSNRCSGVDLPMVSKIHYRSDIYICQNNKHFQQSKDRIVSRKLSKSQYSTWSRWFLGKDPKIHYPKELDADGNKIKETINGRTQDKRSETATVDRIGLNELGSGKNYPSCPTAKTRSKTARPLLYQWSGLWYQNLTCISWKRILK